MTEPMMEKSAIAWLDAQAGLYRSRPKRFSPHEVTTAVGGYPPTLGRVAGAVVSELISRGIKIRYLTQGSKRWFELF